MVWYFCCFGKGELPSSSESSFRSARLATASSPGVIAGRASWSLRMTSRLKSVFVLICFVFPLPDAPGMC